MLMAKDIQISSKELDKKKALWRKSIFKGLNQKLLWIIKAYVGLSIIELIIFPSVSGAVGVFLSLIGILMTRYMLCHSQKFLYYPVSTIALLLYCVFFNIMPLAATLLELKPIDYNMRSPFWTFIYLIYLQIILLATHTLYIKLSNQRNFLRSWLDKFHFFSPLSSQEVWFLVLGSFIWYAFIMITRGLYSEENVNVNSQFGVIEWAVNLFFSGFYQIVFIFYFRKINNIKGRYQINHMPILIIAIAIFIIGIGTNMRTAAIMVFANAIFSLFLYLLYYPDILKHLMQPKYYLLVGLLAIFFFGPFQTLSKSMVAVRNDRAGKNAIEILEMTMNNETEVDNNTLKIEQKSPSLLWNEDYLNSDLLNRFCSLKIHDETLFHAQRLNADDRKVMRLALYDKLIDQIPSVIKKQLGMRLSFDERQYSLSDLLFYLSTNKRYVLGGIKIGSLQGLGFALFGHWFPLILIPVYLIMFFMMDSIVLLRANRLIFPLFFFAGMMEYIAIFSDRHFYLFEFRFILRGYWETVIAYILCINIVKRLPFLSH